MKVTVDHLSILIYIIIAIGLISIIFLINGIYERSIIIHKQTDIDVVHASILKNQIVMYDIKNDTDEILEILHNISKK